MHCPAGNTTDLIWRVLASSDGIFSWTPLKPQHIIPCWLSVQWEPSACRSCQCCQKKGSSKVCGWICSVWPSWVWGSQHTSTGNSICWSLGHSSRSSFHRMTFFPSLKQNFIAYHSSKVQIAFLKFTSCDNQALVGCIPIPALAVHLKLTHRLPGFLESLMPLKNWCSIHARWSKSSLKHSIRFYGIVSKFKTEFYCILFF